MKHIWRENDIWYALDESGAIFEREEFESLERHGTYYEWVWIGAVALPEEES